jgi:triosephosphate isomerase
MVMKKKIYIGTNTKMYKTIADTALFLENLQRETADISRDNVCIFVIPSYTALEKARSIIKNNSMLLGAQNVFWEDQGQFTGEISPLMLKEINVDIVEIGHSERRHILHETNKEENLKVLAALRHGFFPLLCIGETEEQKKFGIADEILSMQIKIGLHNVLQNQIGRCMIAYEPTWAIGVAGSPATVEYAAERHSAIRSVLRSLYGDSAALAPILYGGSVNNDNAVEFIQIEDVDGLFIGRSAWEADNFNIIIRKVLSAYNKST